MRAWFVTSEIKIRESNVKQFHVVFNMKFTRVHLPNYTPNI